MSGILCVRVCVRGCEGRVVGGDFGTFLPVFLNTCHQSLFVPTMTPHSTHGVE